MIISHLVALSNNNVIGVDNDLPWKLKKDLQHFSAYTQNKVIVMGRKTFESIDAIKNCSVNDFILDGYESHPALKAKMAI